MRKFYIFLAVVFLSGCSSPEMSGHSENKITNVLLNKKDKSLFLVGNNYTYIFQDKKEHTRYMSNQYYAMDKLVHVLKNSKSFSFIKKPKTVIDERKTLDGTVHMDSDISLTVEIKPTQEQIDYFDTLKGHRKKNYGNLVLDAYTPRNLQLSYKKTKCFLGKCDDRYIEYILHYRTINVHTVRTTDEMKKIHSKLQKEIPIQEKVRHISLHPKEDKGKKNRIKNASWDNTSKNISIAAVVIPLMVVAIPIVLPLALLHND